MGCKAILRIRAACACLIAGLLVFLAPGSGHAASSDPFYRTSFASPDTIAEWTVVAGDWQFANGEFVDSSADALSIATVRAYEPAELGHDTIGGDFSLDFYALLASSAANARVGVVFDFADLGNYHEVTVSASGNVQLRQHIGGATRTVATGTVAAPGAQKWIHIELVRRNGRSSVWIDGVRVFANVLEGILQAGDTGLIARNTRARFDDFDLRSFGREDPYIEDFDDRDANNWLPLTGTWTTPASGTYTNTGVVATAITQSPLHEMWETDQAAAAQLPYTFKVRMLNPYGGSGNLVGVAWVTDTADYTEAVFSPTGQAQLNSVSDGVRTTFASAAYLGGGRNRWFEVEVGYDGNEEQGATYIKVNGVTVFDGAPNLRRGHLSLITHWSPASFDDVRASFHFFTPFSEDFNDGTAPQLRSATWNIADGTFNNTTLAASSQAFVRGSAGWHELADIELRARMINGFGGSDNLVGLTYGARGPVYYEAVFSPTGAAHLRKVVKNVPTTIATAQFEGGESGRWFDAQLIQIGERTTVKVNGITVFDNVLQPDAVGGQLGFVAHWTRASVDDVSFTQIPVTRYRFTLLPDLPNPVVLTSQIRGINDRGEAVGWSRTATGRVGRVGAVLWRDGRVIELDANADDGSAANDINNKSEIVGGNFGGGAFYWKDGQLEPRLFPDCGRSEALDINESGQVVGVCGAGGPGTRAVLREPDGRVMLLELLPGGIEWASAHAINHRGEIVGGSSPEAVSWQNGMVESLGTEGGAEDINNRGQIIGTIPGPSGQSRAVTWQDRELMFLPLRVGETHAQASGINEHGVIVGTTSANPPADRNLQARATVWQEGRVADLNELIACDPLPESMLLTQGMDINERGEIAVNGFDFTVMEFKAFVLTPVSGRESCDR